MWVYFDDFPTTASNWIEIIESGVAGIFRINVTSAGVLQVEVTGQSPVNGSTLLADTWYRVCVVWSVTNSTTYSIKIFLTSTTGAAGVLDSSVTNTGTLNSTTINHIGLGWINPGEGNSKSMHVDDLYIDDSSALTDTGDIRVTAKLPIGLGTSNAFDTEVGSGPNRWHNVSERPRDDTIGWQQAGSSQVQENFILEAAAVGDVNITGLTLVARCAYMLAKATAGGSGTPGIVDNGSVTAKTLTSATALYTVITDSASYPSNTAGIGMRSTGTTDDSFLTECGTLIAYLVTAGAQRRTRPGVSLGTRTGTRQAH